VGDTMLETEIDRPIFKIKSIWFSDYPFDVKNCSYVIFYGCKNDIDLKDFTKEEFSTLIIDLTQELDQIWGNMSKYNRRDINKAKKNGFEIEINRNYEEFYEINSQFRENKGIGSFSIPIEFMKKYGTLFTAEFNGKIIGGHFYLEDENNMSCVIGSTSRLGVSKEEARLMGDANRLLLWEAITYAKNKGIKEFDLGGYYTGKEPDPQKESINKFKDSFGGQLTTHYIYQKNYSKIYKLARNAHQLITQPASPLKIFQRRLSD
jgi:lipid II:glycine glycyltransferase (peptidoglycan interpeptide bridge formation enzyme)